MTNERAGKGSRTMRVPKQVVDALKDIKRLGLVEDMGGYDEVYYVACECGDKVLIDWLDEHSKADYIRVIDERLSLVKGPYDQEGS